MPGTAQRIKLRLFLEGIEVPVIAATVQSVPNAPAAASIQIPPLPEGTKILPRTLVHLFFLDFYETASPFISTTSSLGKNIKNDPTLYERSIEDVNNRYGAEDMDDFTNTRYKLLFGGELTGFQWSKSENNRSLVLQCQDWSNYWDYAYQWNNTDLFGPGIKAMFSGGSTNMFTDFLEEEGQAIIRILQTPSIQYPQLKGLLGGIVHLLEAIGGSYSYDKKVAGENIFFTLAELRLRLTQMITAYDKDPTSSNLLGADGYDGLFGRTLGGLGQQVSYRQAINALMGLIFHETYAQPCPLYIPGTGNVPSGLTRTNVRDNPKYGFIAQAALGVITAIGLMNDDIVHVVEANNQGADDGLVTLLRKALLTRITDARKQCTDMINRIKDKEVLPTRSFFIGASAALDKATVKTRGWKSQAKAKADASFFGDSLAADSTGSRIKGDLDQATAQLQRAAQWEFVSSPKGTMPARLNQQIFRPDVWFTAPPRCNVLFPEHYRSIQYSRSFLQEPTRLLLKTNDEFFGEDELFDQFYVTPRAMTLTGKQADLSNMMSNTILDHELFTGILPIFEKMGELNIFAARSGKTPTGAVPKIGLAERSANFLYFKYRFAARMISISGKFNPYVAVGFPGLIIDKYIEPDVLARHAELVKQAGGKPTAETDKLLGTHFLANFTEVTHSVDQTSASTSYNCSYARQPDETTEFLGAIGPEQVVQQRAGVDASRKTVVAALNPPRLQSLGPNLGSIIAVEDVTQSRQAQDLVTGPKLQLFGGPKSNRGGPGIFVPVGITASAQDYGPEVVAFIGNANQVVQFHAYVVTEAVPRYRKETVDLPAEEYIRPGWYGDCWHPAKISEAYATFFQTGSITDQQMITGIKGAAIGQTTEEAQVAFALTAEAKDNGGHSNALGLLALDTNSSIQDAVSFIVQTYSAIRANNLDIEEFLRAYTWRPICTLIDIFGSSDLELSVDGHQVLKGVEGFHSKAFGSFDDLFGLVPPDIEGIVGLDRGGVGAQNGDVRKRRWDAVQEYITQLRASRGILG